MLWGDSVEIKIARAAGRDIRNVTESEWMQIRAHMERVFENHPPDKPHGETIKALKYMAVPEFRFKHKGWRIGYNVIRVFGGKQVWILGCDWRDPFYNVFLKKRGVRR